MVYCPFYHQATYILTKLVDELTFLRHRATFMGLSSCPEEGCRSSPSVEYMKTSLIQDISRSKQCITTRGHRYLQQWQLGFSRSLGPSIIIIPVTTVILVRARARLRITCWQIILSDFVALVDFLDQSLARMLQSQNLGPFRTSLRALRKYLKTKIPSL